MKRIAFLLAAVLTLGLLGGCSSDKETVLNYNVREKVESLDPANAVKSAEKTIINTVFEGLCRLSQTGEAVPGAAQSWEASPDFTQFTFHLRKNVQWSDKTPVTAQDFLFGITRALLPETGASGPEDLYIIQNAAAVRAGQAEPSELGISAPDEHTLMFTLIKSFEDFPKLTAGMRYMPCQEAYFTATQGKYGLDAAHTLTNGPFTFQNIYAWEPGEYVNLVRSETYEGEHEAGAAALKITMNQKDIETDPGKALLAGNTDLLPVSAAEADMLRGQGAEITVLNNAVTGLLLNTASDYLSETEYRAMLMKSIDRQDVLGRMDAGMEEAAGIVPKSVRWQGQNYREIGDAVYPAYDESAVQGLEAFLAAHELDTAPDVKILCLDDDLSKQVATGIIVSWNKSFGKAFNLEAVDAETFARRIANGDYQAAVYTLSAQGSTPNGVFSCFRSNAQPLLLEDAAYDAAMDEPLFDRDSYRALEEQIRDSYVFYPLAYDYNYYAISPKTSGIRISAESGIDFVSGKKLE